MIGVKFSKHDIWPPSFDRRGAFGRQTIDRATFDRRLIDRRDIRPPPNRLFTRSSYDCKSCLCTATRFRRAVDVLAQEIPDELQPVLRWFEDNYIGHVNRNGPGRRPPLFPIVLWNMYTIVSSITRPELTIRLKLPTAESGRNCRWTIGSFGNLCMLSRKFRRTRPGTRAAYCWPPTASQETEVLYRLIRGLKLSCLSKVDYLRGLAHDIEMNSWAYRVVQKNRYPGFNFAITSVYVHRF